MMSECKRAALVGMVCGTGKCSLCAGLPVLAAAGIETCVVPTGVLPSPGGEETVLFGPDGGLSAFAGKWKELGLKFDAVASGFPGTAEQADALSDFLEAFRKKDGLAVLGPSGWSGPGERRRTAPEEIPFMERLCADADLAVLQIGDAAALLGEPEQKGPWNRRSVESLLRGVCTLGPKSAVVTGAWFSPDLLGSAGYSAETGSVSYAFSHRISGEWPGSGDLFAAALLAGLLREMELSAAMQIAVDFTADGIRRTRESGCDGSLGLQFEACLPKLLRELGVREV